MTNRAKRQSLLLLGVFALGLAGGFLLWKFLFDKDRRNDLPGVSNSLGMEFRQIPAGTFTMGSPGAEEGRDDDESEHEVEIARPFYFGTREVTQEQFEKVMGFNPSIFIGGKDPKGHSLEGGSTHPVENVSWVEAVEFCKRLSELPAEKQAGRSYRLPTEAEWEYACRAGKKGQLFGFGDRLTTLQANTIESLKRTDGRTTPVGKHQGNRWHMEDMHGNVWEWCSDWYDENYYSRSSKKDPPGPQDGTRRVIRGGSRANDLLACRSANRAACAPGVRLGIGLRVVLMQGDAQ